jgi:hypothetical protein
MTRAIRPDLRSPRRSRRRQAVLACCGASYLALVAAGLLALLSLVVSVGPATTTALFASAGFGLAAAVLLTVDVVLARRAHGTPAGVRLA